MTPRDVAIPFQAFTFAEGLGGIEVLSAEVDGAIPVTERTPRATSSSHPTPTPLRARPGRVVVGMDADVSRSLDSQINVALVQLGQTAGSAELVRLLADGLDARGHDHHELSDQGYWSEIDGARGRLATYLDLVLCQHPDRYGTASVLSFDLPAELLGPVASALSSSPTIGERVLLTPEGVIGSPNARLAMAAAAHAHRGNGRAEVFPGQELLVGDAPVSEVLARTAIDSVISTQGEFAADAVLRAFGYVRPTYTSGALVLSVGHDDPHVVTPWEVRYCRPCCGAEH